jgi:hypothetical protein
MKYIFFCALALALGGPALAEGEYQEPLCPAYPNQTELPCPPDDLVPLREFFTLDESPVVASQQLVDKFEVAKIWLNWQNPVYQELGAGAMNWIHLSSRLLAKSEFIKFDELSDEVREKIDTEGEEYLLTPEEKQSLIASMMLIMNFTTIVFAADLQMRKMEYIDQGLAGVNELFVDSPPSVYDHQTGEIRPVLKTIEEIEDLLADQLANPQ